MGGEVDESSVVAAATGAYHQAGLGPGDVDVIELHDAAAPAELMLYEALGLCDVGKGAELLRSGQTVLGGSQVVNPSGGLLARGHPIGATGCAQLIEIVDQLRGRCGSRQVNAARVGLAQNVGGYLLNDNAVSAVTVLTST